MSKILRLCLCLLLASAAPAAFAHGPGGVTTEQLGAWLETYGKAWETRDADLAVSLFTVDATYQEDPYKAPFQGHAGIHDYWDGVTKEQSNIDFKYEIIAVSGSIGIAQWTSDFDVGPAKTHIGLNGVFVLEFDEHGKVRRLREWWHLEPAPAAPAAAGP